MPVTCVDLSHYQAGFNFEDFKAGGGLGVILKASEALFRDPSYSSFWDQAMDANLAVASYHFLRQGDMKAQAQFFLNVVKPRQGERMVADYEIPDVSLADLLTFLQAIQAARPDLQLTVYSGNQIKQQLGKKRNAWLAANTSLWLAQYTEGEPSWPTATWPAWSLVAIHFGRLSARLQPSIGLRSLSTGRTQTSSSGWDRRPRRRRSGSSRRVSRGSGTTARRPGRGARFGAIDFHFPVPIVPLAASHRRIRPPLRPRPGAATSLWRPHDEGRSAAGRRPRLLICPLDCDLGSGSPGDAGRHRRRQCRDRRPGGRAMGLSPAAAGAHAHSDAVHGAGIDGAARALHRPRPRRTHPRTVRYRLGLCFDHRLGGGGHRLAGHRVYRRRRRRRTVWPVAQPDPAAGRGHTADHRRQRLL